MQAVVTLVAVAAVAAAVAVAVAVVVRQAAVAVAAVAVAAVAVKEVDPYDFVVILQLASKLESICAQVVRKRYTAQKTVKPHVGRYIKPNAKVKLQKEKQIASIR